MYPSPHLRAIVLTSGVVSRLVVAIVVFFALAAPAGAATISPPPPEHRADPGLTTYVERLGPFTIGAYETLQKAGFVPCGTRVYGTLSDAFMASRT